MHPATRELIGTIVYVTVIILLTAGLAGRFLSGERKRVRRFLVAAGAFAVAGVVSLGVAFLVNSVWTADFCNYFVLGLMTFLGSLLAFGVFLRGGRSAPYVWSTVLVLSTVEVLLIPWFLLGFS